MTLMVLLISFLQRLSHTKKNWPFLKNKRKNTGRLACYSSITGVAFVLSQFGCGSNYYSNQLLLANVLLMEKF